MSITNAGGSFGKAGRAVADKFGKTEGGAKGGAGTAALGKKPGEDAIAQAQAARPSGLTAPAGPGGGTTTRDTYTPGAVGNYPDANAGAVADMLSSALPGMGLTNIGYKGAKAIATGTNPLSADAMGPIGDMLGGDPGKQKGFQPDRYRGQASLTGLGGDGGAVNDGPQREIAGQSLGAGTLALTGDQPDSGGSGTDALFSDVTLRDRRKPREDLGAGARMALALG